MSFSFFNKQDKPENSTVRQNVAIDGESRENGTETTVLIPENIRVGLKSVAREAAIEMAGQLLVESGYVVPDYIQSMLKRETVLSTYIGEGVAIPHGLDRTQIIKSGICILQFPDGVEYDEGEKAYLLVGIAGKGNEHLKILATLAEFIQEGKILPQLFRTKDQEQIYQAFTNRL